MHHLTQELPLDTPNSNKIAPIEYMTADTQKRINGKLTLKDKKLGKKPFINVDEEYQLP